MLPKVSVHLPSYRQREFLREAIESVLAQHYPRLEIVVGDDGSTDGTHEMLREYAARHAGLFKLALSTENRGTTANWNQILPLCTGEYVAWLDGDDLWLPGKLHKQVEWLEAHPEAVICYTNAAIFDSASGVVRRLQHEPRRNPFRTGGAEQLMLASSFFATSTVMARRSALPPHGADPRLPQISDWLFWVEVARNGTIGYVPEVLAKYRLHANNITKRGDAILADQLRSLEIVEERYPEYAELLRHARADTLWYHGLRYLALEQYAAADSSFRESFRQKFVTRNVPLPQKALIRLLLSTGRLADAVPLYRRWTGLASRLRRGGAP